VASFVAEKRNFAEDAARYQDAVQSAVRWNWLIRLFAFSFLAGLVAIGTGIARALSNKSGWWLLSWDGFLHGSDTEFRVSHAWRFAVAWLCVVVIAMVVSWLVNKSVADRRKALLTLSETLRDIARELPSVEFTARLHGLAASRLSLVLSKLERCGVDPGNPDFGLNFVAGRGGTSLMPDWAKELQTTVGQVYDIKLEDNLDARERTRQILKNSEIEHKLPTGTLAVRLEAFDSNEDLTHRLSTETLRVALSPAGRGR
jgi:hypothetical protein